MAEPALPLPSGAPSGAPSRTPSTASPAAPAWRPFALMGLVVTAGATCLALAVVHVATPAAKVARDAAVQAPAAAAPVTTTAPAQPLPAASATPAPAATPTVPRAGRAPVYVVYEGQTLSELARRFDTTVAALVALNHIVDPDLIYPGQRIRVS